MIQGKACAERQAHHQYKLFTSAGTAAAAPNIIARSSFLAALLRALARSLAHGLIKNKSLLLPFWHSKQQGLPDKIF
jgi:hypothetical protein